MASQVGSRASLQQAFQTISLEVDKVRTSFDNGTIEKGQITKIKTLVSDVLEKQASIVNTLGIEQFCTSIIAKINFLYTNPNDTLAIEAYFEVIVNTIKKINDIAAVKTPALVTRRAPKANGVKVNESQKIFKEITHGDREAALKSFIAMSEAEKNEVLTDCTNDESWDALATLLDRIKTPEETAKYLSIVFFDKFVLKEEEIVWEHVYENPVAANTAATAVKTPRTVQTTSLVHVFSNKIESAMLLLTVIPPSAEKDACLNILFDYFIYPEKRKADELPRPPDFQKGKLIFDQYYDPFQKRAKGGNLFEEGSVGSGAREKRIVECYNNHLKPIIDRTHQYQFSQQDMDDLLYIVTHRELFPFDSSTEKTIREWLDTFNTKFAEASAKNKQLLPLKQVFDITRDLILAQVNQKSTIDAKTNK